MAAYLVADIEVLDRELYESYAKLAAPLVHRYGGRYLARGPAAAALSGDWNPERMLIIKFDSLARLRECFGSAEYLAIAHLRENSTRSRSVVVEGLAPEQEEPQAQGNEDQRGCRAEEF